MSAQCVVSVSALPMWACTSDKRHCFALALVSVSSLPMWVCTCGGEKVSPSVCFIFVLGLVGMYVRPTVLFRLVFFSVFFWSCVFARAPNDIVSPRVRFQGRACYCGFARAAGHIVSPGAWVLCIPFLAFLGLRVRLAEVFRNFLGFRLKACANHQRTMTWEIGHRVCTHVRRRPLALHVRLIRFFNRGGQKSFAMLLLRATTHVNPVQFFELFSFRISFPYLTITAFNFDY